MFWMGLSCHIVAKAPYLILAAFLANSLILRECLYREEATRWSRMGHIRQSQRARRDCFSRLSPIFGPTR